jgi:cobalt-zinc-cadmium efflux system outer membrane protein
MRSIVLALFFVLVAGSTHDAAAAYEAASRGVWARVADATAAAPGDTLTLARALARVKRANPALGALGQRSRSAGAAVEQAGARPNPALILDVENLGGGYSAFEHSEITLQLSQEIELGGRRSNRIEAARRAADETLLAADAAGFALYAEVSRRYAAVTHAEQRRRLTAEERVRVEGLAAAADDRVRVGAALVADRSLGEAALERARLAEEDAQTAVRTARRALASLWGDEDGFDEPVSGALHIPREAPPADSIAAWSERSPAVAAKRLAVRSAQAGAQLERSLRVPALTASAGLRRVEEVDVNTFVVGLGLPLPLFDRRAAAIEVHAALARSHELEYRNARIETRREIEIRVAHLQRLLDRLQRIDAVVVPAQRAAFDALQTAYGIGRVSYSDLLDSERGYLELLMERNDIGLAIVEERLAIEQLMGATIEELTTDE